MGYVRWRAWCCSIVIAVVIVVSVIGGEVYEDGQCFQAIV